MICSSISAACADRRRLRFPDSRRRTRGFDTMRSLPIRPIVTGIGALAAAATLLVGLAAQQRPSSIAAEQLLAGTTNQSQWLMFGGDYSARRHSPVTQITPQNVNRLVQQ